MGKKGHESKSNALALQLDSQGKIKYDILARQGHSKDKVSCVNNSFNSSSLFVNLVICFCFRLFTQG